MSKLFIIILSIIFMNISSVAYAAKSGGSVGKSLNVVLIGSYSFLTKANQDGNKSIAKGYTVGADASMMLAKVSQGWGFGPFASFSFTQANNSSDITEKWTARNFQAGIRMVVSSIFVDIGYSTSSITFTKSASSLIGLTQGFVTGAGVTILDNGLLFRLVGRYSIETLAKNNQISYSSSFNILMLGAQLGYSF